MARHLSPELRARVVELFCSGETQRAIQALTGVSPQTMRRIVIADGLRQPDCPCGRPRGHKGVCFAMRLKPKNERPSLPNWNVLGARTELGELIDGHAARAGLTLIRVAEGAGISPLRLNHIRHGHRVDGHLTSKSIVQPRTIDRIADFLRLGEMERAEMHEAAARDWGFRIRGIDAEVAAVREAARVELLAAEKSSYALGVAAGRREAGPRSIMSMPVAPRPARVPGERGRVVELEDLSPPSSRSLIGGSLG